jgi:putative sigma-54 modulation protein
LPPEPVRRGKGDIAVQTNISTRHGYLGDTARAKIIGKLDRLSRYFERLAAIDVTIDLEDSNSPTVELRVSAEHKHDFVATVQSGDLWRSLHSAIQKIEQQLRKYKEKILDRHRAPSAQKQGAVARS